MHLKLTNRFTAALAVLFAAIPLLNGGTPDWKKAEILVQSTSPQKEGHVKSIKMASDDRNLYLLFAGVGSLADQHDVEAEGSKGVKFDRAASRLLVSLEGESLKDEPWIVSNSDGIYSCTFKEATVDYLPDEGLMLTVPLKSLGYAPVSLRVTYQKLYTIGEGAGMVAREHSVGLPEKGFVRLDLPQLPKLEGKPAAKIASINTFPATAELSIEADRKVGYVVRVLNPVGVEVATEKSGNLSKFQRVAIGNLQPGKYQAEITVEDAHKNTVVLESEAFAIPEESEATDDYWLSVRGTQLVDSKGKPFRLVGMARCQYHLEDENERFGSWENQVKHYKSLGLNCIRLAITHLRHRNPETDLFEELGAEQFVEQHVAPEVEVAMNEGMYVIIDDHHVNATLEERYKWIPFWEFLAKRYKDEPRVAMYEPWNESVLQPTGATIDSAPEIRQWYKDVIAAIRKHDKRHVIIVSDWNAGWGMATEPMWAPVRFEIDKPYNQVVFSKHMSMDHCNEQFVATALDAVVDKWRVPLLIGELELEPGLQTREDLAHLLGLLSDNPRDYSVWLWRPDEDSRIFADVWSPWAKKHASRVPFGPKVKTASAK